MKTISRYIMTLALLITAVGGAWAQTETLLTTITATGTEQASYSTANVATVSFSNLPDNGSHYSDTWGWWGYGFTATVTAAEGYTITKCVFYDNDGATATDSTDPFIVETEEENKKPKVNGATFGAFTSAGIKKIEVYGYVTPTASTEPDVEVTTNAASEQDLFTEASFTMPAFDATAEYELVRDMQDEANPVIFSGLPSSGNIFVKKGDDGKYQPAEALTIQLIDPVAAADAQNIIAADGITVKVLVGDDSSLPIEYDHVSPITLEAFLADMKPGYYWIKAESTDENSPYDGTVYSSEFTVVEKYDLTVKPANEYSKGKIDAVTVGTESVTIDANGKASKTGIDPDTEVKIKAKRGYVIDKVEAKKKVAAEGHAFTSAKFGEIVGSDGKTYAADDKDNLPKGVTAVAKVCYVDGNGHGLALALADEAGEMNWSTAQTTCAAHTPAITGGTWKLATKDEWSNMITAAGSHTALRDGFSSVGGTNMQSDFYWSSTPISYGAWYYTFDGGKWTNGGKGATQYVRACLAF